MIIEVTSNKGAICAEILATLPHWFGIPESNAAYKRDVEHLPMFAAVEDGRVLGFLALKVHTPHAVEIHVMGVRAAHDVQTVACARLDAARAGREPRERRSRRPVAPLCVHPVRAARRRDGELR